MVKGEEDKKGKRRGVKWGGEQGTGRGWGEGQQGER